MEAASQLPGPKAGRQAGLEQCPASAEQHSSGQGIQGQEGESGESPRASLSRTMVLRLDVGEATNAIVWGELLGFSRQLHEVLTDAVEAECRALPVGAVSPSPCTQAPAWSLLSLQLLRPSLQKALVTHLHRQ